MILTTERLILRPFREGDEQDVYEYLHQPTVHCFMDMKLEDMDAAKKAVQERIGEPKYWLAITLKENGKVIGELEAYPERVVPDETAPEDTFSPCWMLNSAYQGKGYAFEAAKVFFDYLFHDMHARRIYAYTEDNNLPSQHLCQRLGMRLEGVFKEFVSFVTDEKGEPIYENTMQWAILKKEWDEH